MKHTILTLITFFAVAAARAADLITTFHYNPTLSREANPVVTLFGAGPLGFLLVNILVVVLFVLLPLFCFWRGRRPRFEQPPADGWEFVSLAFYHRLMPRRKLLFTLIMFWPLPKDWFQVWRAWGMVISWVTVFVSLVGVASWTLKFHWFHTLYTAVVFHHYSLLPLLSAIIGGIVGWKLFLKCEFYEQSHV